jgi:L-seryl-tRNA(Ser) seleniumtransferase
VCFSGDKLVGGPQAGVIVGRAELVARIGKHPLARAVRADKCSLAALAATLFHYLKDEALSEVPVWRMISAPAAAVRDRAEHWASALGTGEVVPAESTLGGGSLPGESLPTYVLSLSVRRSTEFVHTLRGNVPPVIARTERGRVLLDPRTVLTEQDGDLVAVLKTALAETS